MIKFLVSDLGHYHILNGEKIANEIDNTNGIVDQIKRYLKNNNSILFIASTPDSYEKIDLYSGLLFEALKLSGIVFTNYYVLDKRNKEKIKEYINGSDFIFLSGGDTYIQNMFFKEINLKELLINFDGIIMGQSAGAMNMAENVFNSPEEMKDSEPIYFDGLGLTTINIEPHFVYDDATFNQTQKYQRKYILEESYKREIIGQCNGSHIIEIGGNIRIYGKTYLIKNGEIKLISGACK